jgi:hypothetical protein
VKEFGGDMGIRRRYGDGFFDGLRAAERIRFAAGPTPDADFAAHDAVGVVSGEISIRDDRRG